MKTLKFILPFIAFISLLSPMRDVTLAKKALYHEAQNEFKDPLPSWKDNNLKKAIINYVESVTNDASEEFIPIKDRIATFDNDGTLWSEKPLIQGMFLIYQLEKMIKEKPELAKKEPYKSFKEKGPKYITQMSEQEIIKLFVETHTGMTEEQFETAAREFAANAKLPKSGAGLKHAVYQPQLELLAYLRQNKFNIFICTGGTVEFVRVFSEDLYGVPKYQVIGTSFKYEYQELGNKIVRKPELNHLNDKGGKPVGIQLAIGQRPVFACGNEGGAGDIQMLEFSQGSKYKSFQLIINHDDDVRETAYQEKDNASLNAAKKNRWYVVSMKNDWKEIFVK